MKKIITFLLSLGLLFAIIYSPDMMAKDVNIEDVDLEVHFIDVGQGDSILIKSDGENMLIDGGKRASSETVVNYLRQQGVEELKYIVGTHPHEDHIGGLVAVLNEFKAENIMLPNVVNETIIFEDLLDAIDREGLKIKKPIILDNVKLGNAELTVLAPNSGKYSITNDYSIVMRMDHGNNSFLFTGDAEKKSEKEIIENNKKFLDVDVLKAGHHGSKTSSTEDFLDAVDPKYAIISVAAENAYGHPDKEILDSFTEREIKVYRTDRDGSIVAMSDGKNISFTSKMASMELDDIFVNIDKSVKAIKDTFIIKYITARVNPEEM